MIHQHTPESYEQLIHAWMFHEQMFFLNYGPISQCSASGYLQDYGIFKSWLLHYHLLSKDLLSYYVFHSGTFILSRNMFS